MSTLLLRIIGFTATILGLTLLAVHIAMTQRRSRKFGSVPRRFHLNHLVQPTYRALSTIPLLGRYIVNLKARIIMTSSSDDRYATARAVNIFAISVLITVVMLLFFSLFIGDWYTWFIVLIMLYFIFESVVDFFFNRMRLQLLEQMVMFIDYLRTAYFESHMIDDAYIYAMDKLDMSQQHYVYRQAERIYQVITSTDGELALQRYYQMAPNPFLKLLAGLSYINREYGDTELATGSAFVKSLSHLSAEIKDEIIKRNKLLIGLKSMNVIAIWPLLAMQPLKQWASQSFYPLKEFYSSSLGFVVEISLLIIIVISFTLLRRLQDFSDAGEWSSRTFRLEKWFEQRMRLPLKWVMPAADSKAYKRLIDRQQRAHTTIKMSYHFIHKFAFACIALALALTITLSALAINRNDILYSPTTPDGFLAGELKGQALEDAKARTAFDRELLAFGHSAWTVPALDDHLQTAYQLTGEKKRATAGRIMLKQQRLTSSVLNALHIIIFYVAAVFGWWIPELFLMIKARVLRAEVDVEIARFQLVVMMIMHIEHLTVDQVLEWLEKFSRLFRIPIRRAMMTYDAGAEDALTTLKQASDKADYQAIINHLISAVHTLTIQESFSEFETEKLYYQDKRRLISQDVVKNKVFYGQVIGFIPTYALLILYFMFPLVYASVNEMQTYFQKLSL